jgi:hypothetical protein
MIRCTWCCGQGTTGQLLALCAQVVALGVDAYLQMLLRDNFVHTDLHPGNILVRTSADEAAAEAAAEVSGCQQGISTWRDSRPCWAAAPVVLMGTPELAGHPAQDYRRQLRHALL